MNIFKIGSLILLMVLKNYAYASHQAGNLFEPLPKTSVSKARDAFTENYEKFANMLESFNQRSLSDYDYINKTGSFTEIDKKFQIDIHFHINSPLDIGFTIIFEMRDILYHIIHYKPCYFLDKKNNIRYKYKFEFDKEELLITKPFFFLNPLGFITSMDTYIPNLKRDDNKDIKPFICQYTTHEENIHELLYNYFYVVEEILQKIEEKTSSH